jgi:hypothetical protein
MSEPEPTTVNDLAHQIIEERGGAFSAVEQRIAYALAVALRNPSSIDPQTVARLSDLLPARFVPPEQRPAIPEVVWTDGFAVQLERAIDASPDDAAASALRVAKARIEQLENENAALRVSMQSLRRVAERGFVPEGMVDTRDRNDRTGDSPSAFGGHAARDERHSLTVSQPLERRYPLGFLHPVS